MARWLCVGPLMHLCIAVKPADKPVAKPRAPRTRFSAVAHGDVFLVTAALHERRVTWSFSIEDWASGVCYQKARERAKEEDGKGARRARDGFSEAAKQNAA